MLKAAHGRHPAILLFFLISALLWVCAPLFAQAMLQAPGTTSGGAGKTVAVIPVEGLIDGGLYDSITRRLAEAEASSPALIVFKIDTYGGLVEFAMEITDTVGAVDSPKTVAYVPRKAYSAGAMIAMAAREIVLSPMASIGDAAPVAESPEGPQILGEKMQSPVRNIFRKYAERNGYPVALAEAMVTPDIEVLEVSFDDGTKRYMNSTDFDGLTDAEKARVAQKRVIDTKGQLVTLSAADAREYGFARFIVKDFDELLADYDLSGAKVVTYDTNWSETLVRFLNHPAVSSIILLIGIIAAYMEFKVPGVSLPGAVAVVCFAAFFFSKYLSGMAEYWEILIFIVGMILLGVELFLIPGFGIIGFAGVGMMLLGLILMLLPRHLTTAPMDVDFLFWSAVYFVGSLVGAFVAGIVLAKYLPRAPVVGAFFLGMPEPATVAHREGAGVTEGRELVGKFGTAITNLRPSGKAEIDGAVLDVTTQGDLVARGTRIEVIAEKSNNIIVRELK